MAQTSTHTGDLFTIPPSSTPGLLFLQHLIPTLDALDASPSSSLALTAVLTADATITVGAGAPTTIEQVLPLLVMRAQRVGSLVRELHRAWDVDGGAEAGAARTVLFESTTTTVFREDPEARELAVREFTVADLVPVGEGEGGFAGLKARRVVTYMDAAPVRMRALALFGQQGSQA